MLGENALRIPHVSLPIPRLEPSEISLFSLLDCLFGPKTHRRIIAFAHALSWHSGDMAACFAFRLHKQTAQGSLPCSPCGPFSCVTAHRERLLAQQAHGNG